MTLLPIAIAAKLDEHGRPGRWELLSDHAQIRHRRHQHGHEPTHEVRLLRIDEPLDLTEGATVPIDLRPEEEARREDAERARRRLVEEHADAFIRGESRLREYGTGRDFNLEREVLTVVAARLREATTDDFLRRVLAPVSGGAEGTRDA